MINANETKLNVEKIRETQKELLREDEEAFASIVHTLTVEQIESMTDDELLLFNNFEEGKCYIGEPEFETKAELIEYVRSVMKYLIQSYELTEELDRSVEGLNDAINEANETINEYLGLDKNASSIITIQRAIEKGLEKAAEKGDIDQYNKILKSQETFNESFTLDRLKVLYQNLNSNNLKDDAKSERSITIYKNYLKVQQKLGSRYDLVQIVDLEKRFLPEKYHEVNNLFIMAVIKYISKAMKDGRYSSDTAFFVSQLTTNLFMLHLDKMPEVYKEKLLSNIQEFLDMVI